MLRLDDVDFKPKGESPLARCKSFTETVCPYCGKAARREVDTIETFMCSSWYMLRYPDARNDKKAFDSELINQMLPVDKYVGGAEPSCMHLIYARFVTKVLRDAGYLKFDEPFTSLVHQGTILGPDGQKMSKSKGNTVSPDEYIDKFGSDVFRTYLMFGFNYIEGGPSVSYTHLKVLLVDAISFRADPNDEIWNYENVAQIKYAEAQNRVITDYLGKNVEANMHNQIEYISNQGLLMLCLLYTSTKDKKECKRWVKSLISFVIKLLAGPASYIWTRKARNVSTMAVSIGR